ncbi:MAG TPA: universal stress protein [Pyrinomonadaceae bacterium]|nr:universal stress protein [Pyrinomonadaceae bacterium]
MIKVERILCPLDMTKESEEALRYAVGLARGYGAKLMLCHCGGQTAAATQNGDGAEVARRVETIFEDALAHHLGASDFSTLDWEGFILDADDPGAAITREAAARGADLIVMRSRRRPLSAALLGSTAETVCRTAPCSVLVTHAREREWVGFSAGDTDLGRVLVAHDFSDRSELALQYGLSFARKFGAELHLLHVLPEPVGEAPELAWVAGTARSLYHDATRRLEESVTGEEGRGVRVVRAVLTGKPYEEVLAYAAEHEIDLICLGSDGVGHGLLALFGSNADRVLRLAPCPTLIARPYKPSASRADDSVHRPAA